MKKKEKLRERRELRIIEEGMNAGSHRVALFCTYLLIILSSSFSLTTVIRETNLKLKRGASSTLSQKEESKLASLTRGDRIEAELPHEYIYGFSARYVSVGEKEKKKNRSH